MNSHLDFNATQEEKSILNQIVTQALQCNQTASLKNILTSYDYFLSKFSSSTIIEIIMCSHLIYLEKLKIDQKNELASNLYQLILQLSRKVQSKKISWYNIIDEEKENKREENFESTQSLNDIEERKRKKKNKKIKQSEKQGCH